MTEYTLTYSGGPDRDVELSQEYPSVTKTLAAAELLPNISNIRVKFNGEEMPLREFRVKFGPQSVNVRSM